WAAAAKRPQPRAKAVVAAADLRRAKPRSANRPRGALSPNESQNQPVAKQRRGVVAVRVANVRLHAEAPNEARALPAKRRARANAVAELPPKIHKKQSRDSLAAFLFSAIWKWHRFSLQIPFVRPLFPLCLGFSLELGAASLQLFFPLHRMQAARVQLQQMISVLVCFGSGDCPLEARPRRAPAAVARGHGNKFHHIQRNVFIAPRPYIKTGNL